MQKAKARLFPIQSHEDDFFAGVCADGRQVVMGLLCPAVAAYFFDAEGNYLASERRRWSAGAAKLAGRKPPYTIFGCHFRELTAQQTKAWQTELGFRPGNIYVKQFSNRDHTVGIEILPSHYQDLETTARLTTEVERRQLIASRDQWLEDGSFVWWWGKDYYMSKEGEVEST
jgi:hypothetical protein